MTLLDSTDVFFGITNDGHVFATLDADWKFGGALLERAGFTAHQQHGRTVYLLPEQTVGEQAQNRVMDAFHMLSFHTHSLTALTNPAPTAHPDLSIKVVGESVTATARTDEVRQGLSTFGFSPKQLDGQTVYVLPLDMPMATKAGAIAMAETSTYAYGQSVHIDLGIPTRADIGKTPPSPSRGQAMQPAPATQLPRNRRTR
ncbi:hypothetical protein ACFY0R_10200 [Streptomyces sp. NPDC001633]|uniref:hypothetical protein n=1 Tax=Streptomyces sp. NPDC001633 TaxID=3364595 RepID=UPI00369EE7BC